MPVITALQLQKISRKCDYVALAPLIDRACAGNGVSGTAEVAAFLATCCVESLGLTRFEENLDYSIEALMTKFGRHRISEADARKFGRLEEVRAGRKVVLRAAHQNALANILYGGEFGRRELGNTEPGDGWRYRGGGPGQVTGRRNYGALEQETGLPFLAQPERLRDPAVGFEATARLWKLKGMSALVSGPSEDLRRRWNGGALGLAEYKGWLIQTRNILGA